MNNQTQDWGGGATQPAGGGASPNRNYALWADRVFGALIDGLVVSVIGIVFLVAISIFNLTLVGVGSIGADPSEEPSLLVTFGACGWCIGIFVLVPMAYLVAGVYNKVYLVSKNGQSIGQKIMGLRVIDKDGMNLSMATAFIRLLAQVGLGFVPVFGWALDLLFPLFDDPTRQTLHDKAVGSYVIKVK